MYGAGLQPPTVATGGDGVVVLENPAYSVPTDLQPLPGSQPPTAITVDGMDKRTMMESMNHLIDILDFDHFLLL